MVRRPTGWGVRLAAALVVVLAAVPASAARQAAGLQPLGCSTERAFFIVGSPTQLDAVTGSPGSLSLQPIGTTSHGITYNALGFRSTDGLFYAVVRGTTHGGDLVQIDAAGTTRDIGATTPALPGPGLAAGTFDAAGVFYLATRQDNVPDPTLYEVDVAARTVTTIALTVTSSNPAFLLPNDFVFIAGKLWGEQDDNNVDYFIRIDPGTGQVDLFPDTAHVLGLGPVRAGAAWTAADGSLSIVDNNTGNLWQVAIGSPNSATPTFTLGASQSLTPLTPPVNIDGTSCPAAPPAMPTPTAPGTGTTPGEIEHQGHAGSNNDPNPNTNPTGVLGANNTTPAATATTMQPTVTTVCSSSCTLAATTADEQLTITATDTTDGGSAYSAASATTRPKAPVFLLAINGGGARPRCPGYRNRDHDWVRFGFRSGPGATFEKSAMMTSRQGLSHREAEHLLDVKQVCFEAPYRFLARPGFASARHGEVVDGVLPGCHRWTTEAAVRRHLAAPCVSIRQIVRVRDGWAIRLVFRVPPNRHDPKALG